MPSQKVELPCPRLGVRNSHIETIGLKDPLTFFEHFSNIQMGVIPTHQGVYSRLINNQIKHHPQIKIYLTAQKKIIVYVLKKMKDV